MDELIADFITSLDGYASAEGWPGWWGLQGPEYMAWLEAEPEDETLLMGASTYRVMSELAVAPPAGVADEERDAFETLTAAPKVVFSSSLDEPLTWPDTTLVRSDPVEWVRARKRGGTGPLRTIGSLRLCRSLLEGGVVDRFRVVVFPVITGRTGRERIYDGYPDVALKMVSNRTFDGRLQLLEYAPRVLNGPPAAGPKGENEPTV